jgi:two-component system, NtrC family, sensor histidine kinase GlrK
MKYPVANWRQWQQRAQHRTVNCCILVNNEQAQSIRESSMKTSSRISHLFSFSTLLLGGFLLVVIPLLGGIYNMSHQVDRMSLEGRRSVQITEEATLKSRQIAEAALSLQRASGQFYVLQDPALLGRLEKSHERFLSAVAALAAMPLDEKQAEMLDALAAEESSLYQRLRTRRHTGGEGFEVYKPDFDHLHLAVSGMTDQLGMMIQRQQTILRETGDQVQQTMIWQSTAVIGLSLLLAALLSWLLSRPVRQLSQSIQRLGGDDLETPVRVAGPRDMVSLGNQLDWLRQRLIELEEQKQRFFRQVSHELKTPLTALWEATDLLSNRVAGNLSTQQEEIVEIMYNSVRVLRQRIEELLHYQHVLYQTKKQATSSVSFESLIETVARSFDLSLKAKHLKLSTTVSGEMLLADKDQMEVVLSNLISNAIRFSPDGAIIEVVAQRLQDECHISVCDQGPGVPAEDRAYIFQPFYQSENQPPGLIQGSGLGLAIARAHVEAQGGELRLSDEEGSGTCFLIKLPVSKETQSNEC